MDTRHFVTEGIETAGPDATVEALALRMEEAGVGSVVIEEGMEPVGMVTDRDLALRVDARDLDAAEVTAADVMTVDPVTVDADADILTVTETMKRHAVRRLPVVDDGTLVGIVTLDDVLVSLERGLSNLAGVIQAEARAY